MAQQTAQSDLPRQKEAAITEALKQVYLLVGEWSMAGREECNAIRMVLINPGSPKTFQAEKCIELSRKQH